MAVLINYSRLHQQRHSRSFNTNIKMIRPLNVYKDDCLHHEEGNQIVKNNFFQLILKPVILFLNYIVRN
jgi:hypothetical protein